ncbi:NAD(P)-binding protein [Xylariaceae sp. FL0255]|nr:NAD(P)-binding protein [Xylariaceae sp. FL0255]
MSHPLKVLGIVLRGRYFVTLPIPTETKALSESTIIVTGANGGLGFESSKRLSQLGVRKLIMAVRSLNKGEVAKKKILETTGRPESSIDVWSLDMENYASIEAFANRASQLPRLDGVLANAGIMTFRFESSEGTEKSFNVNVIGTFLLYALLLPQMRESGKKTGNACRFSIPNSALHLIAPIQELKASDRTIMDRLSDPKTSDMAGRYNLTKLLVVYVVRELAKRNKGSCIVNTPSPSFCKSNLGNDERTAGFKVFQAVAARTGEEGSRTLVHGLLAGPETNGQYLNNCKIQTPSPHVTSDWGEEFQERFFDELLGKLESIRPGISSNI